jgi:hypothetical protein
MQNEAVIYHFRECRLLWWALVIDLAEKIRNVIIIVSFNSLSLEHKLECFCAPQGRKEGWLWEEQEER